MPRIRPYLTSLASAFVLALPALAGDQAITINGTDGFDPTAVATFVTKFEGELHTLDISIEDSTVELDVTTENPTNGLWHIESTRPDGATFYLADASAHQDHSSSFTFKQKTKGGGGGGGGGNKTYEAISQQIQIFASYPGEPGEEVPRPTSEGDGYYGIILPDNAEKPVRIRLVYNREEGYRFSSSTISLEIASGLKIVNRDEGKDTAASIAEELLPGTEVTFDVIHNSENVPVLTQPQPITLILTDQFGAIHEDEVNLLPVEVKEVWSDQITGVEANGFPDKTGPNEHPYIFMGATSGTTFKVKIKLAAEIPAAVRSQILFRWASEGVLGEFLPETGTSTFSDGTTVQLSSNFNINVGRERFLIWAFDENKNGQIDFSESETLIKMPHIRRGVSTSIPCKFIPIAQSDYEDSRETLLAWASSPLIKNTLRNSGWHLTGFCNGAVPAYAGSQPTTIKRNEPGLSHPVGAAFTPTSTPGVSFIATISKDHDLSIKLIESNALRSWLAAEFNSVADGIRADIVEARGNGTPAQVLSYSIAAKEKSLAFGIIDPDLLLCLGKVTFENPTIEFDVDMFGYVSNVKVWGLANDLYDFDYEGEEFLGYPARKAAQVQAGYPSLGNGGKVFKTEIDLGGGNPYANPDLTPYTFFPN